MSEFVEQRSAEWFAARLGKITGSRLGAVTSFLRSGDSSKERVAYMQQLALERLTGKSIEVFETYAMRQGTEREPAAKRMYTEVTGREVQEAEFTVHPTMDYFGSSPDGLIGIDGVAEFKCPQVNKHIEYLQLADKGEIPDEYQNQVNAHMMVTGREWCDFCTFNPDFPDNSVIAITRVEASKAAFAELECHVRRFETEVQRLANWLATRNGGMKPQRQIAHRAADPESAEYTFAVEMLKALHPDITSIDDMFDANSVLYMRAEVIGNRHTGYTVKHVFYRESDQREFLIPASPDWAEETLE